MDLNLYLDNGNSTDVDYGNLEGVSITTLDCNGRSFSSVLLQPSPLRNSADTRLDLNIGWTNVNPNSSGTVLGLNDQNVSSRSLDSMMLDHIPYSSSQLAPFDYVDYGQHLFVPFAPGSEQRGSSPPAVEMIMFGGRRIAATPVELIPQTLRGPSATDYAQQHEDFQAENDDNDMLFGESPLHWSYEDMIDIQQHIGFVSTGLNEDEIGGVLRRKKFELRFLETHDDPCSICQEEYKKEQEVGILKCNHEFHLECINKWLLRKNSCPLCRQPVTSQ